MLNIFIIRAFNFVELNCSAIELIKTTGDALALSVYFMARLFDYRSKCICLKYTVLYSLNVAV